MEIQKKKKRVVASSAAVLSIAFHVALLLVAGSMVALKFYKKQKAGFQVEQQKPKLERRKLQMPQKSEPFIEQMSKPKLQTTSRITANTPQMVNIPEQGEYVKMAPMPSFQGGYTNFVQMDRTMEFNSKYRDVSFGVSAVDFFGTRGKAEKVAVVVDTSKSMLYDERGGADSYQMVQQDLREVIENMRSATLFNVVLFDNEKVALFNPALLPATPAAKTNVLEWVGGINTNLTMAGLSEESANYTSTRAYDIPMDKADITGWLKGLQAALEQKPEIIFVLCSDWGSITTLENNISYFMRRAAFREYQKKRAELFLEDDDAREDMDEYLEEFSELHAIGIKMLELENNARIAEDLPPKVVRDWDEILIDNDVEMPDPPVAEELAKLDISVAETRYTLDEVLETFFVVAMDNYRELGLPQLNFVMLTADGYSRNTAEGVSKMTSDSKFRDLTKMVDGRFRYLEGMPKVDNLLSQSRRDIEKLLEAEGMQP